MGHFYNKFSDHLEHRAKYGTANSTANEKGTDNKKNNTSTYNHEYYMKHKEKWKTDSESVKKVSDFTGMKEESIKNLLSIAESKGKNSEEYKDLLDRLSKGDSEMARKIEDALQEKEFDVDAAARDVIRGKYKNGAERKAALGDDYELVQKRVNELMKKEKSSSKKSEGSDGNTKKKAEDDLKTFEKAKTEYYNRKKKVKHSEDVGSIFIKDLF